MHCFVYHPIQLKLFDAQGKHKGLVNYNKNHGISILKKRACPEHPDLYKKWKLFLLQRVTKTKVKTRGQRRGKLSPFVKSQMFLATNGLITNQILYSRPFWKTWFFRLQRVTGLYLLLKVHGYGIWFCGMWPCIISIPPPNDD